jgi:hypothetical protein
LEVMTMKTNKMTVVGAWILGVAASVFLGHVMTQEPVAAAAQAPRTGTTVVEHAKVVPTIQLDEIVIAAPKPVAKKATPEPVRPMLCQRHVLEQEGSPNAQTVWACD